MRRKLLGICLVVLLIVALSPYPLATAADLPTSQGIYLGVEDYNEINMEFKDFFKHRFWINGEEQSFLVSSRDNYKLQNQLMEGYFYNLSENDGTIVDLSLIQPDSSGAITKIGKEKIWIDKKMAKVDNAKILKLETEAGGAVLEETNLALSQQVEFYQDPNLILVGKFERPYTAPVSGIPGKKTIKNFLQIALEPVGTTLYIYGGAWDWQDVGSSVQATTIGLHPSILRFFQAKDELYTYRNNSDPTKSYYPHQAFNQYYYAGMDCSGYVGWVVYNTLHKISGEEGYVGSASKMAQRFANDLGLGSFKQETTNLKPGDIFSMPGHVWIVVGTCDDGSAVIAHSTPSLSYADQPGGGVQLTGIGEDESCEAYALAKTYMERYYPTWSQRYPATFRSYDYFTSITSASHGKFSWYIGANGLEDPENFIGKDAKTILAELFAETSRLSGKDAVKKAKELGITPGKLNLIYHLMDASPDTINIMDWIHKSKADILKAINQLKDI